MAKGKKSKKSSKKVSLRFTGGRLGGATPEEKLERSLERMKERKLISKKIRSLLGVTLERPYKGKTYVLKADRKGWKCKTNGKRYDSLYDAAKHISKQPANGYAFFKKALAALN